MVEIVGDYVEPSELRVPKIETNLVGYEGILFLSGSKLWFNTGSGTEVVTSG